MDPSKPRKPRSSPGKARFTHDEIALIERARGLPRTNEMSCLSTWVREAALAAPRLPMVDLVWPSDLHEASRTVEVGFRLNALQRELVDQSRGAYSRSAWIRDSAVRVALGLISKQIKHDPVLNKRRPVETPRPPEPSSAELPPLEVVEAPEAEVPEAEVPEAPVAVAS